MLEVDLGAELYECLSCTYTGIREDRDGSDHFMAHAILTNHHIGNCTCCLLGSCTPADSFLFSHVCSTTCSQAATLLCLLSRLHLPWRAA